MKHYSASITNGLVWLKMFLAKHVLLRSLDSDAANPDVCQTAVLKHILEKNRNTAIGMYYNFASITNVADFIKQVPVNDYE